MTGCTGASAAHTAEAITSSALQATLQPLAPQSFAPSCTSRRAMLLPASPGSPLSPFGPAAPASPLAPCGPAGPCGPGSPLGPAGPCGPIAPSLPATPAGPGGPAMPAGPGGPAGPTGPCAPASPFGPAAPAGPCGPSEQPAKINADAMTTDSAKARIGLSPLMWVVAPMSTRASQPCLQRPLRSRPRKA